MTSSSRHVAPDAPKTLDRADVVIVGGAVVGSACAYFLALRDRKLAIVVVERDPSYAACATARSAGGLRQQFSTVENIRLSRASLAIICDMGLAAEVGFHEHGYLILAGERGRAVLEANVVVQRGEGADITIEDAAGLANRFPWLAVDGIAAGAFGQSGEGWLDPASLMNALRREAKALGVTYLHDDVVGVELQQNRVSTVRLASGRRISCGALVNAAGPAAGQIAELAGLALPVEPRKRFVYVLDCRDAHPALAGAPLTVDPSGVWFRPEGRVFLAGRSPHRSEEPADLDLDVVDHAYFEQSIWPDLAARIAAFEAVKVINAWAGFYDYNTLDQNAIIGRHPVVTNFLFANGFSGHGLQQAPAVGRAIAELLVEGRFVSLDLARFGYERIACGEALAERNVI